MARAPDAEKDAPAPRASSRSTTAAHPKPWLPQWVGIRPKAIEDTAQDHELTIGEQYVLLRVLLLAWPEGTYSCTQGALAGRLGYHRSSLCRILDRLRDAKVLEYRFSKGHGGYVRFVDYGDLVHVPPPRAARDASASRGEPPRGSDESAPAESSTPAEAARKALLACRITQTYGNGDSADDPWSHVASRDIECRTTRQASRERLSISAVATATGEAAAVIDIDAMREQRHGQTKSDPAGGSGGAAVRPPQDVSTSFVSANAARDSDGGGNDPAPVHPRSRKQTLTNPLRTTEPLRDPRAMSPATASGEAASGFSRWA